MSLTREAIVEQLQQILGDEQVLTDAQLLRERSIDNFRKLQNIFGVYTMPAPAAVAMVRSTEEVAKVLAFADAHGVNVVARTGGTATEGGLETPVENSIVVDGGLMNRIVKIDPYNMQATVQCGVPLQLLEDAVRELGLTTGHSPQSKPIASMGGLVATRSIGQFSTLYGGIEDMVVGCEVVFPGGQVSRIKNVPRRAAGPDIRHIVIGNEGVVLHHGSHREAVPVHAGEQHLPRLDAEEHEGGLRGAARGDGGRLQAQRRSPVRPGGRPTALLALRRTRRLHRAVHGRRQRRHQQGDRRGHHRDRGPAPRVRPLPPS